MIRFSLRSRHKGDRRTPADRPQSPPGAKSSYAAARPSAPAASAPTSFLVNYDALPTRRPDGLALAYDTYTPSRYHSPSPSSRSRRRTRSPAVNHTPALDLGLDPDSLQRNQSRKAAGGGIVQFVPVDKRIRARIAELRVLLADAEQLGDIEVLKDLVGIHAAKIANHKRAAQTIRSQIKEAKIIAGIVDNPVVIDVSAQPRVTLESRSTLIRKVSGKPMRHFSGRTVSALKSRTASMRSNSRNHKSSADSEPKPQRRGYNPPGPMKGKPELSKLSSKVSRKSSARLKRLGSAGGILIRRLSKVSVAEDASTASSAEAPVSSTFDQETMKRLRACPEDVLTAYESELARIQKSGDVESAKLREAKQALESRREMHDKIMEILDQFYGSLPGWEDDPIAVQMLPETSEMTEAGLESERDLAEMRVYREKVCAAHDDSGRCLRALRATSSTMSRFTEDLEKILGAVDDAEGLPSSKSNVADVSGDILNSFLRDLEKLLQTCVQNAETASICCVDAPRVDQVERDLRKLAEGFAQEAEAVMKQGRVVKNDFAPTLQVAKAALCDCKLAETFIGERYNMISEDLDSFDTKVERYEEYVIMERVGILDAFHPVRSNI